MSKIQTGVLGIFASWVDTSMRLFWITSPLKLWIAPWNPLCPLFCQKRIKTKQIPKFLFRALPMMIWRQWQGQNGACPEIFPCCCWYIGAHFSREVLNQIGNQHQYLSIFFPPPQFSRGGGRAGCVLRRQNWNAQNMRRWGGGEMGLQGVGAYIDLEASYAVAMLGHHSHIQVKGE